MTERLARWSYRRRWLVLGLWVVALLAMSTLGSALKTDFTSSGSLPDSESQHAQDLLEARFPQEAGGSFQVVFEARDGVTSPPVRQRVEQLFAQLQASKDVQRIDSPYDPSAHGLVSDDGTIAIAPVQLGVKGEDLSKKELQSWIDEAHRASGSGLRVELGGELVSFREQPPVEGKEFIGVVAAIVILLAAFGSVIAAGLPIVAGMFGVGIGLAVVNLLTNFVDVPEFAPQVAAMIGIGVGIDYALFILTRHRHALQHGKDPRESVLEAAATSGRAVIFAGTVVVISLLGILLMRFQFLTGLALGAAACVVMVMLAAVTLLPAILGFAGTGLDRLRIPFVRTRSDVRRTVAWRWSRQVQRRPWAWASVSLVALVLMAVPLFSMHLAFADASNNPSGSSSRAAYEMAAKGFGPGFNGPLVVAVDMSRGGTDVPDRLVSALREVRGVADVQAPRVNDAGDAAVIVAYPTTSPQDQATQDLVNRIRDDVVPSVQQGTRADVLVGGITAANVDFSAANVQRLPFFVGTVIVLSFVLLLVVFRSVLVPLKAAVMNLLSVGAAYGVVVAAFQWGWGRSLLGIENGPIEPWAPMMLFAILFGLSMDYEVFLISRVREEYVRTGDNAGAVADGLASTARVITAAAAIMICVFFSFVFTEVRALKLMGLGLSVAVFVDATIVRMILVPSTMELLGRANWWFPAWLERLVPRVSVEREPVGAGPEPEPVPVPSFAE